MGRSYFQGSGYEVNLEDVVSHGGTRAAHSSDSDEIISRVLANRGSRHFSLDRISLVAEEVGNPQRVFPVFHVAGTNGKGSVSCAIAGILGRLGKSVVLTISPHLERVNERVVVNGRPISDSYLAEHLVRIDAASRFSGVTLSLHEAMTLTAFLEGHHRRVDYGVFEVGLGGRLDSTNITPRAHIGVITSISLDHTELLGDTVEAIAGEKSAIVKPSMKAMVVGRVSEGVLATIEASCRSLEVPVVALGRDFTVEHGINEECFLLYRDSRLPFKPFLSGDHQIENAAVALMSVILEGFDPILSAEGLQNCSWPGRLERVGIRFKREIILDCAHNPAGIEQAVSYVRKSLGGLVDCVFGCLATKDWRQMVNTLLPITRYWCLMQPTGEQAVPNQEIAEHLSGFGISCAESSDWAGVETWCKSKTEEQSSSVPVLIIGSMYMLGAVRTALEIEQKPYWIHASPNRSPNQVKCLK